MPLVDKFAATFLLTFGVDDDEADAGVPAVTVATVGGGPVTVATVGSVVSVASMGGGG